MSRIAVFVSGNGTHLPYLIRRLNVVAVVCNRPEVPAIEKAEEADKPLCVVDSRFCATPEEWEAEVQPFLLEHKVDLIILAGFMRVLSPAFVQLWPLKIINVHPSLLPAFPGKNAIQQALDYGAQFTGATVHFVDEGVDTGPIICQIPIDIRTTVDFHTLKKSIQGLERRLLFVAANYVSAGDFRIEGRTVLLGELGQYLAYPLRK